MANVDRPFGARVVGTLSGSHTARATRYRANEPSDTIYVGQFVKFDTNGYIEPAQSGDTFLGVVIGVGNSDEQTHGKAGLFNPRDLENEGSRSLGTDEEGIVLVADEPHTMFEIQAADGVEDLTPGATKDITNELDGDTVSGNSLVELDSGDDNSDVRVIDWRRDPENDPSEEHAVYHVVINNHVFK